MRVRKQEALNATTSPDGRPSGLTAGSQRSTDPSANEHSALQPHPPILSQRIEQCFIPVAREIDRDARIRYEPVLLGRGEIHFEDTKSDVSISRLLFRLVPTVGRMSADPWDEADSFDSDAPEIHHEPVQNAGFIELPSELSDAKNFTRWKSALEEHVYRNERITLYYCERLTEYSRPQETEGEFRIRLRQEAREQRDVEMEKLRKKFASRLEKQEEAILRAEHRLATEEQQAAAAKKSAWISTGTSLLGALLGRKWASVTSASRAGTAMRAHTRASQQAADIEHASQKLERESEEKRQLEDELKTELERIHAGFEVESLEVTPYVVKPRKSDIKINSVCLLWRPFLEETDQPAWHQALAGR